MVKALGRLVFVFLVLAFAGSAYSQQLLMIKHGKVVYRFNEGDGIYFRFKDDRQIIHTTIQDIREFHLVTVGRDTIPYARIGALHFRNEERRKYGVVTTITGFGLLAVYGINTIAFDEDQPSMRGLRFVAIAGIIVGSFIYFRSERTIRLDGRMRLKFASYDSPLYR